MAKKPVVGKNDSPASKAMSSREVVLLAWEAPARPFQKKDFEFWTTVLSILALVCLILFFAREWFLIVALISFIFLYYALTTVKPGRVENKITNKGVYLSDSIKCVDWRFLRSFWFSKKWGHRLVNIETVLNNPRIIQFVISEKEKRKLENVLIEYLPKEKEEAKRNFIDALSAWLLKNLPLETKNNDK